MKIILIRHGLSKKNVLDKRGDVNTPNPLTDVKAVEIAGKRLSENVKFDAIFCSTNDSAKQTASIIANFQNLVPIERENLRSVNLGVITGMNPKEVAEKHPDISRQLLAYESGKMHPKDFEIAGLENFDTFEARIKRTLNEIFTLNLSYVGVIAHRSTITMILNLFRNHFSKTIDSEYKSFSLPILSVSIISANSISNTNILTIGAKIDDEQICQLLKG